MEREKQLESCYDRKWRQIYGTELFKYARWKHTFFWLECKVIVRNMYILHWRHSSLSGGCPGLGRHLLSIIILASC